MLDFLTDLYEDIRDWFDDRVDWLQDHFWKCSFIFFGIVWAGMALFSHFQWWMDFLWGFSIFLTLFLFLLIMKRSDFIDDLKGDIEDSCENIVDFFTSDEGFLVLSSLILLVAGSLSYLLFKKLLHVSTWNAFFCALGVAGAILTSFLIYLYKTEETESKADFFKGIYEFVKDTLEESSMFIAPIVIGLFVVFILKAVMSHSWIAAIIGGVISTVSVFLCFLLYLKIRYGGKTEAISPHQYSHLLNITDLRSEGEKQIEKEAVAGKSLGHEADNLVQKLILIGKTQGFLCTSPQKLDRLIR